MEFWRWTEKLYRNVGNYLHIGTASCSAGFEFQRTNSLETLMSELRLPDITMRRAVYIFVHHVHADCAVFFSEIRLYFLVWHLVPTHCRCAAFCCIWSVNDTYTHTHTLSRIPLDEGSACRRKLYRAKHNVQNRETAMPTAGFEPTIQASERRQTLTP